MAAPSAPTPTGEASSADRTRTVIKQSGLGLTARVGSMLVTFITLPLLLQVLGAQELGVWLVLASIFQWIAHMDFGVSSGARNEIAKAAAVGKTTQVQTAIIAGWVTTTVIALLLAIAGTILVTLGGVSLWFEERVFDGASAHLPLLIVLLGACANFSLSFIQTIYAAHERPAVASAASLLINLTFLAVTFVVLKLGIGSLSIICGGYVACLIATNSALIFRFLKRFQVRQPILSRLHWAQAQRIVDFGLRLFVVQVSAMTIFTSSRLLAGLFEGPEAVVVYDAGYKLFFLISSAHSLVMASLWSSYTHAVAAQDWAWVKATLRNLELMTLPLAVGCLLLAWVSPWLISHWLGNSQVGPKSLYLWMALATILSCWSNVFAYFLNGVGDVNVQMRSSLVAASFFLPGTYFFAVILDYGTVGIVIATAIAASIFAVVGPIRTQRWITQRMHT